MLNCPVPFQTQIFNMKFDHLVSGALQKLTEAPLQSPGGPTAGGFPADLPPTQPGDMSAVAPAAKPEKITSEGKRFMVEMVVKALAFDPQNMSDEDKDIFNQDITPENADEILNRIEQIISASSVPSSDPDDQF